MSIERELLEMAAKAAGLPVEWDDDGFVISTKFRGHLTNYDPWNPLIDDGDALRLLAAMPSLWSLSLKFGSPTIVMDVAWGFKGIKVEKFSGENIDRAAAIRRAIVEAAAEMGRTA